MADAPKEMIAFTVGPTKRYVADINGQVLESDSLFGPWTEIPPAACAVVTIKEGDDAC